MVSNWRPLIQDWEDQGSRVHTEDLNLTYPQSRDRAGDREKKPLFKTPGPAGLLRPLEEVAGNRKKGQMWMSVTVTVHVSRSMF